MGVRSAVILIAGLSGDEVLRRVGTRPALGPVVNGWVLIVDTPLHFVVDDEAAFARLVGGATAVTHYLNETVGYADAAGYEDGQRRWFVARDPDNRHWSNAWPRSTAPWWRRLLSSPPGPSQLCVEGEPPGDLPAWLAEAVERERQNPGVDHQSSIPGRVVDVATGGAFPGFPLDDTLLFRELVPERGG